MKETAARCIRRHRGEDKFPSPHKKDQENDYPASKVKGIYLRVNMKEKISKKGGASKTILFFSGKGGPLPHAKGPTLWVFLEERPALQAAGVLIGLHKVAPGAFHSLHRDRFIDQESVGLPQTIALRKNTAAHNAPRSTIVARSGIPIPPEMSFYPVFRQTSGNVLGFPELKNAAAVSQPFLDLPDVVRTAGLQDQGDPRESDGEARSCTM